MKAVFVFALFIAAAMGQNWESRPKYEGYKECEGCEGWIGPNGDVILFPWNVNGQTDCTKFLQCGPREWAYEMICPPGLVFNPALRVCDYKCNVPEC